MSNPWFRLYSEFADDPKVQMMPEAMQRRLIMLFCERCKDETFHETERAFHWRISDEELAKTKTLFLAKGFIDDAWQVVNWNQRQYVSDSSTERVRRHRKGKERDETLQATDVTFHETPVKQSVTAPDTEADTDTEAETESTKAERESAGARPPVVLDATPQPKQPTPIRRVVPDPLVVTAPDYPDPPAADVPVLSAEELAEQATQRHAATIRNLPVSPEVAALVTRIVLAHPRSLDRVTRWNEVTQSQQSAVLQAMTDEMVSTNCSAMVALGMILERVELQAQESPPEQRRFFKDVEMYMKLHEYRLEPDVITRKDKPHANRNANRAQQRTDSQLDALRRADLADAESPDTPPAGVARHSPQGALVRSGSGRVLQGAR